MSKIKRPSFLPLNTCSISDSEYYFFKKSNLPLHKNVNSPTNSVDSEYSSANTPSTESATSSPMVDYGNGSYLPYSRSPIGSTIPIQSPNLEKKNFSDFKYQSNSFNLPEFNILNSSFNEVESPDWYDESIDLNGSFNFYESTKNDFNKTSELDKTITESSSDLLDNFNHGNLNSETGSHDLLIYDSESDDESFVSENCPIKFKELMDIAEKSLLKCIKNAEDAKSNQPNGSKSNISSVGTKFCKFCKNNREPRSFYLSHSTMNSNGDIVCPILQNYRCDLCGSTGSKSHTRSYCPYGKLIRENVTNINDTFEFYNKRSMIHSTDSQVFDNELKDDFIDD